MSRHAPHPRAALTGPPSGGAEPGQGWSVAEAEELYGVRRWGSGYFSVNAAGHVAVHPTGEPERSLDLKALVDQLGADGLHPPLLIRFSDILRHRVGHIAAASGVKIRIEPDWLPLSAALSSHNSPETIQRWALAGGDDYELCFCLGAGERPPVGCTRIGRVDAGEGVDCGFEIDIAPGYQHFSA